MRCIRLLAIVTILALPTTASAEVLEVTARSGLNIRRGPGLQHDIIRVAPNAAILLSTRKQGKWIRVGYDDMSGWVHGDYVVEVSPYDPSAVKELKAEKQVVTAGNLNFREGPSTNFESFGLLPRGTTVEVIGEQGKWRKVRVNGRTAWVHGDYLGEPSAGGTQGTSGPSTHTHGASGPSTNTRSGSGTGGGIQYGGKTISAPLIRTVLQRIAAHFNSSIRVTSGDRNHVPQGGSTTSWHLKGRAADFHVNGVSDEEVFNALRANRSTLLKEGTFELIWHTAQTNTSGQHLHIANRAPGGMTIRRESNGNYVSVN